VRSNRHRLTPRLVHPPLPPRSALAKPFAPVWVKPQRHLPSAYRPTRYIPLMANLTPIESEFATSEDAAAHDAWFRAKVERAIASTSPSIPHDQVMAKMQAIIERAKRR
jgi:hypothetical protein